MKRLCTSALAAVLILAFAAPVLGQPVAKPIPACFLNAPPCVLLTPNADFFTGGAGAECVGGIGGGDTLNGNGGDDFLLGGDGDDNIRGGGGDDCLQGGDGNDSIRGNSGNDHIICGDGNFDYADGGSHNSGDTCESDCESQVRCNP